ncbi:hypothetical protein Aduo_006359 [Ancylostoma duodenale]
MRILWVIAALLELSLSDLPSCERARCGHCELEFIARMCEKTCNACPRTVVDLRSGSRMKVFAEGSRSPFSASLPKVAKQENVQFRNAVRQAGVPTQTRQVYNINAPRFQLPRVVQLAAPQTQVAAAQYPTDASTLAPLIAPPRPVDINRNLAQQPADLAQPLPEYQQSGVQNAAAFSQQPQTQFQQSAAPAQQQQFYGVNANAAQQPGMTDIFGRPLFPAQGAQNPFQLPQQQQTSPLLNPFQPFVQQGSGAGAQSILDPFGLFNLAGMANLAQGTALTQVSPTATAYNAQQNQQSTFRPTTPLAGQQTQQTPQQNPQALPAPYYNQQQQQNTNVQQSAYPQQQVNNYQGQQQQYQAYQNPQTVYGPQNIQQSVPQQANGMNQHYQTNQAQVPQQYAQNQVAVPPAHSQSIDSAPINVHKYADGKGPAPANLPLQCPRQPGWAPCISKQTANERFSNCCARLGEGCTPLCNYDAPLSTMQLAVLTGRCPLNKMADIMVCASGYEDATACCEAYNVFEPGYEQCRPYCNPAAGLPQGGLLSEKYKCLVKLSAIQQCFYVSQKP